MCCGALCDALRCVVCAVLSCCVESGRVVLYCDVGVICGVLFDVFVVGCLWLWLVCL